MENNGNKPVRVAHIIGKLNAAGVEAVVNNYYRHIDHNKFQFDYYIDADSNCQPPQELIDMGARYIVIPPYQQLPQHLKALEENFRKNKYQIVHSGMNTLAVFSLYAAWRAGVPIRINHNHSTAGRGETKRNIMKYALRPFAKIFATDYCACSGYAGEWLFGRKAMENGQVTVFNNGVDLSRFKLNDKIRNQVRTELDIENKLIIGHVGRFCYQKNHDFLIDIFKNVHEKNPNSVLLLVGIGELTEHIKKKTTALGLTDCVRFLGVRKDVDRLYQAMDVFVLPSYYEGLPVVGVEAQASGLPCMFSDAMTAETNMTSTTKMLSLSLSVEEWADAVLQAATIPRRDTHEEIGNAGFDIAKEAHKMEDYYSSLLSNQLSSCDRGGVQRNVILCVYTFSGKASVGYVINTATPGMEVAA